MIVLRNLTKIYTLRGQRRTVVDNVNMVFPSKLSIGLLGRNGAGKTTLLRMIAGNSDPTSGEILSTGSISFPVGFAGSFHPDLTGAQNTRFVARIYGADTDAMVDYVEDFAELGTQFHLPVRSYSSGMKSRLSFGVSMGLHFDTYLIDEITAVGDANFKKKSSAVMKDRMKDSGSIFISHSTGAIRDMCTAGAVLEGGQLTYFDDIEEAIALHNFNMEAPRSLLMSVPERLQAIRAVADRKAGAEAEKVAAAKAEAERAAVAKAVAKAEAARALPDAMGFPGNARMLFVIGAAHSNVDGLSAYLRRHRACHFGSGRTLHYFDVLAGQSDGILQRRRKALAQLVERLPGETGEQAAATLRQLRETADLVALYEPIHGAIRHRPYIEFLLRGRSDQPVICDITPTYARLDSASFADMASIGTARFLFILRDPVDRAWAQICAAHPESEKSEDKRLKACKAEARKLIATLGTKTPAQADYVGTMARLEAVVPPERIKYVFHEDLTSQGCCDAICAFLEIPSRPADVPPEEQASPALPAPLRAQLRQALAAQYAEAEARFGDALPEAWC